MKTTTKAIIALSAALALSIWIASTVIVAQRRYISNQALLHQTAMQAESLMVVHYRIKADSLDKYFDELQAKHLILLNKWALFKFRHTVTDTMNDNQLRDEIIKRIGGEPK